MCNQLNYSPRLTAMRKALSLHLDQQQHLGLVQPSWDPAQPCASCNCRVSPCACCPTAMPPPLLRPSPPPTRPPHTPSPAPLFPTHTWSYPFCRHTQVVREVLPSNKVNLSITVPGAICQEGFTETVKIMRRCAQGTHTHRETLRQADSLRQRHRGGSGSGTRAATPRQPGA